MNLILNEKKYTEQVMERQIEGVKPSLIISLLSRYYCHENHWKAEDIVTQTLVFMNDYYSDFVPENWLSYIEYCAKQAEKYPLTQVNFIPITEPELKQIASINDLKLERLLFTSLCLAKFHNQIRETNNNWVNFTYSVLFKTAHITASKSARNQMIRTLKLRGYLETSTKGDNNNLRIAMRSPNAPSKLQIEDLRELGYEYLLIKGQPYIRCQCCNRLTKKNSNRMKYCKECSIIVNRIKTRDALHV